MRRMKVIMSCISYVLKQNNEKNTNIKDKLVTQISSGFLSREARLINHHCITPLCETYNMVKDVIHQFQASKISRLKAAWRKKVPL